MFGNKHIIDYDCIKMNFRLSIESFFYKNSTTDFIMPHVETIICVGGLSNDPMADFNPTANMMYNYEDTKLICEMAKKYEVPKFIYASSASVYGLYDDVMVVESDNPKPSLT
jgi:nucleoside-diphosphate-sugar epimerase